MTGPPVVGSLDANLNSVQTYIECAQADPTDARSLRYALNALANAREALASGGSGEAPEDRPHVTREEVAAKLASMQLSDNTLDTGDDRDQGYMEAVNEFRLWLEQMAQDRGTTPLGEATPAGLTEDEIAEALYLRGMGDAGVEAVLAFIEDPLPGWHVRAPSLTREFRFTQQEAVALRTRMSGDLLVGLAQIHAYESGRAKLDLLAAGGSGKATPAQEESSINDLTWSAPNLDDITFIAVETSEGWKRAYPNADRTAWILADD